MIEEFDTVYEDENLIVVDKPAGFLSVPSRMGKEDPRPVLGIELQKLIGAPIFPVHRLDEETSGVLLFAKTKLAQSIYSRAFEQHKVQKTYQALTNNAENYQKLSGSVLKNNLFRGKKRSFEAPHGQYAETHVSEIKLFNSTYLMWTLLPKTGRSHQLRVQLSMRGFPIVGDKLYGSNFDFPSELKLPAQCKPEHAIGLRAIALEFENTKELLSLGTPLAFKTFSWS